MGVVPTGHVVQPPAWEEGLLNGLHGRREPVGQRAGVDLVLRGQPLHAVGVDQTLHHESETARTGGLGPLVRVEHLAQHRAETEASERPQTELLQRTETEALEADHGSLQAVAVLAAAGHDLQRHRRGRRHAVGVLLEGLRQAVGTPAVLGGQAVVPVGLDAVGRGVGQRAGQAVVEITLHGLRDARGRGLVGVGLRGLGDHTAEHRQRSGERERGLGHDYSEEHACLLLAVSRLSGVLTGRQRVCALPTIQDERTK